MLLSLRIHVRTSVRTHARTQVTLAALDHTRNVLAAVPPESFEPVVHSFLQALAGNIATSNKAVSASALSTVDAFMGRLPPAVLCPALVSLAEHHGSARVRIAMLNKLTKPELGFLRGVHDAKPILFRKHIVPLAARLLVFEKGTDAERADVGAGARLLVQCLRAILGDRALLDIVSMAAELPRAAHDAFRNAVLSAQQNGGGGGGESGGGGGGGGGGGATA